MGNGPEILNLEVLLAEYPNTSPVRKGEIRSPRLNLNFADVKTASNAFKQVVRDLKFDVAELAIVTYLAAKAHNKPLVLLPVVLRGKFQHESIVCSATRPPLTPKDLPGCRIGIRSHSVTTVTWVRGILQNEYDVDLDRIKWVTFEDAHVEEILDPDTFERAPAGKDRVTMLVDGELDAAVVTGPELKDPRIQPVISNPDLAAQEWYQRNKLVPINHMVVVKESLSKSNSWAVEEFFRILSDSKKIYESSCKNDPDPFPLGVEANRKSLEMIIKYVKQQGIIPREFEVDELFDDVTRVLGR